jgi:hypothetical protein
MNSANYNLKYLFTAEMADGDVIQQTPEDKAQTQEWGSAFSDVIKREVKRFSLIGEGHTYMVDLTDGHIEIDGNSIYSAAFIPAGFKFDLIYYRQVQQRLTVSNDATQTRTMLEPIVRYFIGWKCDVNGKNQQWEIGID